MGMRGANNLRVPYAASLKPSLRLKVEVAYRPSGAGTITAFGSTLGMPKCPLR